MTPVDLSVSTEFFPALTRIGRLQNLLAAGKA